MDKKITLKEVKAGTALAEPIYKVNPYVVMSKKGVVLAAGDLKYLLDLSDYFDEFTAEVRQHDMHANDNSRIQPSNKMNTNEPKFTKGEWRTLLDGQGECMVMHPTKEGHAIALLTETHRAMFGIYPDWEDAKLIKETGRTWKSLRDERNANCLLIASAPDLYAALELALKREENRLSAVDGTNFDQQTLAELDDARNAIAIYSAALDRAVGKGGV